MTQRDAGSLPWALIGAVVGTLTYAVGVLGAVLSQGSLGRDFGVFHAGGRLISDGRFDAAYDPEVFSPFFTTEYYEALAGDETVSHFISPPPFGWTMQPLSMISYRPALALWLVAGAALLFVSARLLDLPRWAAVAMLLSPAMAANIALGQAAPFFLLIVVGIHLLVRHDRVVLAGLLAGLLILKPTLALGYGLWWLIRIKKWYPACLAAAVSGAVVALPTFMSGFGPWSGFVDAMQFRVAAEGSWRQQSLGVSEFIKLAHPNAGSVATLITWAVSLLAGAALIVLADRRWRPDRELLSATAVIVTVLASPHVLIYDALLLVIPLAVARSRGVLCRDRFVPLYAIHALTVALGPVVYVAQYELFGRGIGLELIGFIATIALLALYLVAGPARRDVPSQESPLSVDRLM